MSDILYWDILDDKRRKILSLFNAFDPVFYLAGGTALALQIGHRDSLDFDFFTDGTFSTRELYNRIETVFKGYKILKIQDEENTLTVLADDSITISFFRYPYPLIEPLIKTEYFEIDSIKDIACMKLSAITGRSSIKDYIDLYFILQRHSLSSLLTLAHKKFPSIDPNLMLKSLVYFDDIIEEPISYKHNNQTDFKVIKEFIESAVKNYLASPVL